MFGESDFSIGEWYEYVTENTGHSAVPINRRKDFQFEKDLQYKVRISRKDDFLPFRMSTLKKKDWKASR